MMLGWSPTYIAQMIPVDYLCKTLDLKRSRAFIFGIIIRSSLKTSTKVVQIMPLGS